MKNHLRLVPQPVNDDAANEPQSRACDPYVDHGGSKSHIAVSSSAVDVTPASLKSQIEEKEITQKENTEKEHKTPRSHIALGRMIFDRSSTRPCYVTIVAGPKLTEAECRKALLAFASSFDGAIFGVARRTVSHRARLTSSDASRPVKRFRAWLVVDVKRIRVDCDDSFWILHPAAETLRRALRIERPRIEQPLSFIRDQSIGLGARDDEVPLHIGRVISSIACRYVDRVADVTATGRYAEPWKLHAEAFAEFREATKRQRRGAKIGTCEACGTSHALRRDQTTCGRSACKMARKRLRDAGLSDVEIRARFAARRERVATAKGSKR